MNGTIQYQTPKLSTPDSKKGEDWHKNYAMGLLSSGYFPGKRVSDISYWIDYYHGRVDIQRDHNHIIHTNAGVEYPMDFANYNSILPFIEFILGEAHKRGTDLNIIAQSKSALDRKYNEKLMMEVDFRLLPFYAEMQEKTDIPLIREDMSFSRDQLNENQKNYKDMGEIVYQRLIDYIRKKIRWESKREGLQEDALVSSTCFFRSTIRNGFPYPEPVDPRTVIFDYSCNDPWGEDMSYIGTVEYMPVPEAVEKFGISKEKLEEIDTNGSTHIGYGEGAGTYPVYRVHSGYPQVLVSTMYWKDTMKKKGFEFQSKSGRKHYHIRDEEVRPEDRKKRIDSEARRKKATKQSDIEVEVVRKCTIIGGSVVVDWGMEENMVRTFDDWQETQFPIVPFLFRWKYGKTVSIVEQLIPLQKLKDRALYFFNKAMKKDRGVFIVNDVAQLPDGYTVEDQDYFADVNGMLPISSKIGGINANYNQWQTVDASIRQSAMIYIHIAQFVDQEMEKLVGLSPARMGQVAANSQPVGTTEISRHQSSLRTNRFYEGFDIFVEKSFGLLLGQLKICMTKFPEKFKKIIGDDGFAFLQATKDFNYEDYGASVSTDMVSDEDKATIRQMTTFAVQNQQIDFLNGLEILMEKNPKEALIKMRKHFEKMDKRAEQEKQQQQQMQQASMQQQSQIEAEKARLQEAKINAELQKTRMQTQGVRDVARKNQQTSMNVQELRNQGEQQKQRIMNTQRFDSNKNLEKSE